MGGDNEKITSKFQILKKNDLARKKNMQRQKCSKIKTEKRPVCTKGLIT